MVHDVKLSDKYTKRQGRIFATGIQALVRLPLEQSWRDRAQGLNTAGYVTGYRGSPLGAYDQQLQAVQALLSENQVTHVPAVNEDLAATACQGTQQVGMRGDSRYDGVFTIWYGKGPGVDRSGDAIRHGNLFGAAAHGGVLLLLGDDHICESSTTAHQSEYAMVDALVPVLNPSNVEEILDYGLLGIAMSRYSGAWVSLKCIHDTVESTASFDVDPKRPEIVLPEESETTTGPRNTNFDTNTPWPPMAVEMERRSHTIRFEAAKAFARANRLDQVVFGDERARIGVVSTGKSFADLRVALDDLGIDDARAKALGLRVYKVGMTFPLEPVMLEQGLAGLEKVIVFEEKRGLIETQLKEILYPGPHRPVVIGKLDEIGAPLFPSYSNLNPNMIALALGERLLADQDDERLASRVELIRQRMGKTKNWQPASVRLPWFCPGCPHNSSTFVPKGSEQRAGIGCHFMVTWMDRETFSFTQMGGEGAGWLGEAPFSTANHMFQNIGDGTFYHSGSLTIRAAVAAKQNITYKVLFNDAVAMTGGQKMEHANLTVPQIAQLLVAEGVVEVAVVSDEPGKYPIAHGIPHGVRMYHRDELMSVQERMRSITGVTAIIYDQACAAEKRRRRKRGQLVDPDERVIINELVCEGCGDCGVQSNCVAIQPNETEFGRKRRIDQSACNKDFSCINGFCPSFVSVHGGVLRKRTASVAVDIELSEPELPALNRPYTILVTGVGGTGVITIAALLGMAAHLEGKGVAGLDMLGLAQKGGAVVSHLKIAASPAMTGAPRLAEGSADLLLGCDIVVAAGRGAVPMLNADRSAALVNLEETLSGSFTSNPDEFLPTKRLLDDIGNRCRSDGFASLKASRLAAGLLGDAIGANLLLTGYAFQKGWLPVSAQSIVQAIAINGVAVRLNTEAFLWGRKAAVDLKAVEVAAGLLTPTDAPTLAHFIDRRAEFLTDYQDHDYAERYRRSLAPLLNAPHADDALLQQAAASLFKLMAIKDEYEVARLMSGQAFQRQLAETFESHDRLEFHLSPPLIASTDPATGKPRKLRYGAWMMTAFRWLAPLRRWRGTRLDLFGRTAERQMERALLAEYEAQIPHYSTLLSPNNRALITQILALPQQIRGYGHVKAANVQKIKARCEMLNASLQAMSPTGDVSKEQTVKLQDG